MLEGGEEGGFGEDERTGRGKEWVGCLRSKVGGRSEDSQQRVGKTGKKDMCSSSDAGRPRRMFSGLR